MKKGLSCFVLALGAFAVGFTPMAVNDSIKVGFSESLRKESLTTHESSGFSSSTESRSVSVSKWNMKIEVPLSKADYDSIGPTTEFALKFGAFSMNGTLDDDTAYRAGDKKAQITVRVKNESSNSYTTLAAAKLQWTADKLTVNVESKANWASPLVASDFTGSLKGGIEGESPAVIRFGSRVAEGVVPFKGKLNRKTAGNDSVFGEVVTIDLKGDLKG